MPGIVQMIDVDVAGTGQQTSPKDRYSRPAQNRAPISSLDYDGTENIADSTGGKESKGKATSLLAEGIQR